MQTVDEFWAAFFGLSQSDFLSPEPKVVPHAGLQGYNGVWLFRHGSHVLVSAPAELVSELQELLHVGVKVSFNSLTDEEFIELLGDKVDKVIGPAFQGFLPDTAFRALTSNARLLTEQDEKALYELRAACDAKEWEYSDIEIGRQSLFGCFDKTHLVAASTYRIEQEAAFPGLITHPDFRGLGYGKAVLSKATEHGLSNGLLMLYQTLLPTNRQLLLPEVWDISLTQRTLLSVCGQIGKAIIFAQQQSRNPVITVILRDN